MKKSICIILSILMLCTTFTGLNITVMANELSTEQANKDELAVVSNGNIIGDNLSSEILYSGSFEKLQWSLDSNGLLTISGNGDMIYSGSAPWSDYCDLIKKIVIENGVTSIDWATFSGCSGLTSITIPNSVTSIGGWAFCDCSGLTSITIPNSVTSIDESAFRGCSGLTSITIPNSVTSIGNGAFSGCSGLTRIIVKDGNSVYDSRNDCNAIIETSTNKLIQGCKTTIIPNSVTSIGDDAFRGCSGLTSITIPNSVTSIGIFAFYGCSGLTSVTIPNGVTTIDEYAFSGCSRLTSIAIPNSVTSIGYYAFCRCSGLTSITIPNSVTSIGYDAFYNCDSLTDVYYSGTKEQWEAIKIMDDDCFGDATIHYGFSFSIGDVNLDGKINILDATTIQKHLAQIITLDDEALALVDTNGDGKINILDATQIQKYLAKLIPSLG